MEIILLPEADKHLSFWKKTGNKNILKKISKLLSSILETPYEGIGKPETTPKTYLFVIFNISTSPPADTFKR
jgi:toxin YoeB